MRQFRGTIWVLMFVVFSLSCPAAAMDGNTSTTQGGSGNVEWSIYMQTGFQHMDVEYKASFLRGPFIVELADPSSLNIRVRSANLWMGGIGADIKKGIFSGFLDLKATIPRTIHASTPTEPFYGGQNPVDWYDSHWSWWAISTGAGLDITRHIAIQAGFNWEHLYLSLRNPIDQAGIIPSFQRMFGDSYSGRLTSDLFIPWIGVKVKADRFNGTLRFSPLAYTDLDAPFKYTYVITPHSLADVIVENERYTFGHTGIWLEGNLAYDIYRTGKWGVSFWSNASWLWTRGATNLTYRADRYQNAALTSITRYNISSGGGYYYNGTYSVGLRVSY
jgi:hypothetical protein